MPRSSEEGSSYGTKGWSSGMQTIAASYRTRKRARVTKAHAGYLRCLKITELQIQHAPKPMQ